MLSEGSPVWGEVLKKLQRAPLPQYPCKARVTVWRPRCFALDTKLHQDHIPSRSIPILQMKKPRTREVKQDSAEECKETQGVAAYFA